MSNKFAEMSVSAFCDYVANNPGGAKKALDLRKKYGGGEGPTKTVVEYVKEIEWREKVVKVPGPVQVVEKKVEVPVEDNWYQRVSGVSVLLLVGCCMGLLWGGSNDEVRTVVKEVPGPERVVKVPSEPVIQVKEVKVVDEEQVRLLRREVAQLERDNERLEDHLRAIHTGERVVVR